MRRSGSEDNHGSRDGARTVTVVQASNSPSPKSEPKPLCQNTPKEKTNNAFAMMMMMRKSSSSSSSSKKRKRNLGSNNPTMGGGSKFVLCPAGCGNHILPHEMNKHLDVCLLEQAMKHQELQKESPQGSEKEPIHLEEEQNEGLFSQTASTTTPMEETPPEPDPPIFSSPPDDEISDPDQIVEESEPDPQSSPKTTAIKSPVDNKSDQAQHNAFAHMMKNSAKAFAEQEASSAASLPKLSERMHLHHDGRVTLTCYRNSRIIPPEETIAWSATIQVRGNKEAGIPPIDLLVTSSIPSLQSSIPYEPQRIRLVRKHSRLSVPVLKSILQKGIRRRKPLPSVRVAAELADKSLGDLLRRLPIVILEDSTLHPEFPFLVWLMMAVSKDYQPPLSLLKRVLGIVFEMASCRWQDSLPLSESKGTQEPHKVLTLASLHKRATTNTNSEDDDPQKQYPKEDVLLNQDELMVWSMLMRGQYGGMACDIRMLQGYAELWHERYHSTQSIPPFLKNRLSPSIPAFRTTLHSSGSSPATTAAIGSISPRKANGNDQCLERWNQVPDFIHKSAAKHSVSRIDRLLMAKPMVVVPSPSQSQSPTSIQDSSHHHRAENHNSFVGLPSLSKIDLTPEGVDFHCSSVLESAILSDPTLVKECFVKLANSRIRLPRLQERRKWLEGLLKSCMWKFGGGVNFRLPMVATESTKDDNDMKDFYESLIKPRVDAFSERYIDERINKR